jgi:hypothetical protein
MRLRDLSQKLKTPSGLEIKDQNGNFVTAATLVVDLLCGRDVQKEPNLTNATARERVRIADKIADAPEKAELTIEQISTIAHLIELYNMSPLLAARCLEALEKEIPTQEEIK